MRISSPLVLTFLLNAVWQVALIAGLATLGSWLLRNSVARYRHWLWASALCLAFFVPALTASQALFDTVAQSNTPIILANENIVPLVETVPDTAPAAIPGTFRLNQTLGFAILAIYFAFLLFRIFKLIQAWQTTRSIRRSAVELEPDDRITEIIHRCELEDRDEPVSWQSSDLQPRCEGLGRFRKTVEGWNGVLRRYHRG